MPADRNTRESLLKFRRLRCWLWSRQRWQEYTKALQDEVDSRKLNAEYLRARMMVAVSFLTPEQYDVYAEHVKGLDDKERARVRAS